MRRKVRTCVSGTSILVNRWTLAQMKPPRQFAASPQVVVKAMRTTAALLLLSCGTARAQNTPEIREILSRLERIEKDNDALRQQVGMLLARLTSVTENSIARTPVSTDGVEPAEARIDQEQLTVQQSRVEELAETKVESSQRFPIHLTGMALFNAYLNGRANSESMNPTICIPNGRGCDRRRHAPPNDHRIGVRRATNHRGRQDQRLTKYGLLRRIAVTGESLVPAENGPDKS